MALCLTISASCSFSTGDSSGDSTTGDSTNASGEANVNNVNQEAGGDANITFVPDNRRNPEVPNPGGVGFGTGDCFIEVYKPESENGTLSVLFSKGCPQFNSVTVFRRPLEEVPDAETEEGEADQFEPFEEEAGMFTSRIAGIAKWAFRLPGKFYTGDIIAEVTTNEVIPFNVKKPGERAEDVGPVGTAPVTTESE